MAHPLECRCGAVRGLVETGKRANHSICYCKDCQAWAHFLGRADDILDAQGGTEVVQTTAGQVRFTQGSDRLACVRLSANGPLRWYARCCDTPIGNTADSHKVAFVGLLAACLRSADRSLTDSFGPVRMWVFTAGAKGEPKPVQTPLAKLVLTIVSMTLGARLDGSFKRTPFFDVGTGQPVAAVRRLGLDERARLDEAVDGAVRHDTAVECDAAASRSSAASTAGRASMRAT